MFNSDKQVSMHKDFFDRIDKAMSNEFYLEAVFCEYAAIEGRLEVICGLLGCPCNKYISNEFRKEVKIGKRITCLKRLYKKHPACIRSTTKMNTSEWKSLEAWIKARNQYVHGLYKNPDIYRSRINETKKQAVEGSRLSHLLYNETKRIRRIDKNHPELMIWNETRCKKPCYLKE